ncbi:MAG: hypothetical protein WDN00_07585 [Limisphaerales bacterium]
MFIRAGSWFKYPSQHMSKIVGIDLGTTTNSLVATVDSGITFVIADANGRRPHAIGRALGGGCGGGRWSRGEPRAARQAG